MRKLFMNLERQRVPYLPLFMIVIAFSLTSCLNDPDLLWHIKLGEEIILNKSLSVADTFSWQKGLVWYQQEWIFDCFIYLVTIPFGGILFEVLYIVNNSLILYFGMLFSKAKNKVLYFCVAYFMFAFTPANHSNRPIEFSVWIIFCLLWVYIRVMPAAAKTMILFLGGILLSNFHGGMVVSFAGILVSLILVECFLLITKRVDSRVQIMGYFCSLVSFLIGIMVCPSGPSLYKHLVVNNGTDTTQYISEWAPWAPGLTGALSLAIILLSIGFSLRREDFSVKEYRKIGVLASVMAIVFLYGAKGGTLLVFAVCYIAFPYIESFYEFYFGEGKNKGYGFLTVMGIAVSYFVMFFDDVGSTYFQKIDKYLPDEVISVLKEATLIDKGDFTVYNDYLMGNFLVWHDIPCFVDSRQVPYTKEFSENGSVDDLFTLYLSSFDIGVYNDFFDKYGFKYVLESKEFYLKDYLGMRGDYLLLYDNGEIRLWVSDEKE